MRLAISPNTPRTPDLMACIHQDMIFAAVARLNCPHHDIEEFATAFGEKSYLDLPAEDQKQLQGLGVTPAEYARWEAEYSAWKAEQLASRQQLTT